MNISEININDINHPVLSKLYAIMLDKKTRLCVSADLIKANEILELAESVGDKICVLKTHVDIIEDFSEEFIFKLKAIADKYNFLIFEDRKFADIGNTVYHQVKNGIYHISKWADIINAHIIPGPGIIEGLKKGCDTNNTALLLLAQMSSKDNYFTDEYIDNCIKLAKENRDFVIGFIGQQAIMPENNNFITMTPGVSLENSEDNFGQNYNNPEYVINKKLSDIIIVGRGIYESQNTRQAADNYSKYF